MTTEPLTVKGAERLRERLSFLKKVERPRIIQAIAEARAHGDLSENAEYHSAREQQSFIEGRINSLETTLAEAQIIDVLTIDVGDRVAFGATVELINLENDKSVCYQIVGEAEADIDVGMISIKSPVACALIGKEKGDVIDVDAPSGVIQYEIVNVVYQ